ncbi:MAG: hypothetical protein P4K98_13515 [Bryobacteraceae bacterium]|nr:hypothetical protein [Bryobacteraceae bacterium]
MRVAAGDGETPGAGSARRETEAGLSWRIHPALKDAGRELHRRGLARAGGVFGISVLLSCTALPDARASALPQTAQQAATPPAESAAQAAAGNPAAVPRYSYVDGQLSIRALNVTLADILTKVASLTGVKIDVPAGAYSEKMPFVELGPGPAREILADLLSDSSFDYLLAASETDPEKIQSVLIMPREKKGARPNRVETASRSMRSPYGRAAAPGAEASEPEPPPESPAAQNNATPDAAPQNAQPGSVPSSPSTLAPSLQPGQSNVPPTFPVAPPATLDAPTISQQLQQMYQQRAQMNQQARQTTPGTNPPNN